MLRLSDQLSLKIMSKETSIDLHIHFASHFIMSISSSIGKSFSNAAWWIESPQERKTNLRPYSKYHSKVYWKDFPSMKNHNFPTIFDINEKKIPLWHYLIDDLYDLFRVIEGRSCGMWGVGWMVGENCDVDTGKMFFKASKLCLPPPKEQL